MLSVCNDGKSPDERAETEYALYVVEENARFDAGEMLKPSHSAHASRRSSTITALPDPLPCDLCGEAVSSTQIRYI